MLAPMPRNLIRTTFTAACMFGAYAAHLLAGDVTVKQFRAAIASKDPTEVNTIKVYISGLGNGIEWAMAPYAHEKKTSPLFCPPEKMPLNLSNYIDLIESAIKADHGGTPDVEDSYIGMWLVLGLTETFPCK